MEDDLYSIESEYKPICRICYSNEEDRNWKLIWPWECKGSIRFVHNMCIQQWAKVVAINTSNSMESLRCELWHSIFKRKRQLDTLKNIIKSLYSNWRNSLTSHFETILILTYVGFLSYRGISDARTKYPLCKKRCGRLIATLWIAIYSAIMYFQIFCLLKREIKKLLKFLFIIRDSLFAYRYWDNDKNKGGS